VRKINTRDYSLATRTTSREVNRRIVLNLVRESQPVSRAALARKMGVPRGTVSLLVSELLEAGEIYEGELGDSSRGRKPKMLYVRTHDRFVVAVDVRFRRTFVMLTDFAGQQIALEAFDTVFDPAELVTRIAERVRRVVRAHGPDGKIEGLGLVVPGMVDQETGRVLNSPQLGWRDVDVRDALARAVELPVYIENAPIACARALVWMGGGGVAAGDFAYVTVWDGVGVGLVVGGQVLRGHDDAAGEFGHIALVPGGAPCLCGRKGCWEAYTSNVATLSRYLGFDRSPREALALLRQQKLTVHDLVTRARMGDERALGALRETGRYLGMGITMILNALNPGRVFIGGEVSAGWDLIEEEIAREVAAGVLTEAVGRTPIIPEQTSAYPRLRGAAALVAAPYFAAPQVA
jgi:predicted NBD/HSP70 family sugar kinase